MDAPIARAVIRRKAQHMPAGMSTYFSVNDHRQPVQESLVTVAREISSEDVSAQLPTQQS